MPIKLDLDKSKVTLIITILCLITSVGRFVMDSYLPSMPAISDALHMEGSDIELTLTLYLLGFGVSQLIYGSLSDRYGRKCVLIGGLIVFLIGNTLCSITSSAAVLFGARFIAGIGGGACGVLNRAIASDCFSGTAFTRAWSYTTTSLVLVLIFAPLVGGIVQEAFSWRANFILAILYVCVVLAIILWKLPETNHHKLPELNLKKVFASYLEILSSPRFVACTLCYTFSFAGLIAYFQVSPLMLMDEFGLTPVEYGFSSIVIAGCYFLGGILVNQLTRVLSINKMLMIGILMLIVSGVLMWVWNLWVNPNLLTILLPTAIYVVGARIVIPNSIAGAFTDLRHLGGSTSGLVGSIQMLGSALISLLITNFSYETPLPLAGIFIALGTAAIVAYFAIDVNKKYAYLQKVLFKRKEVFSVTKALGQSLNETVE